MFGIAISDNEFTYSKVKFIMTPASEVRVGGMALAEACQEIFRLRMPESGPLGWSPKLRSQFGYYTPDEWYEATLFCLVDEKTDWLDVGCGHDLFPSNRKLADVLAARCHSLTGVDPDDSVRKNRWLHEYRQCRLEDLATDQCFDLISLRMVAEHIADPIAAAAALGRLTREGGRVVIYTVSKWAPASLVAAATPLSVHHVVKRALWGTEPEDTFPTVFRMNTRRTLDQLFRRHGFVEESFLLLNDCRALGAWRTGTLIELSAERALRAIGLPYPDVCILGVYRKEKDASPG